MRTRGSKIYTDTVQEVRTLFGTEVEIASEERVNGRDAELIQKRNVHLAYRYHYYAAYQNKVWPVARKMLSEEFYLSEMTVYKIVQENSTLRRKIMNENPSITKMREMYPYSKW